MYNNELLNTLTRFETLTEALCLDIWRYIQSLRSRWGKKKQVNKTIRIFFLSVILYEMYSKFSIDIFLAQHLTVSITHSPIPKSTFFD